MAGSPPNYKPKIWVTPETAYAPGTLAKMRSMSPSPRKKSKARHPARHNAHMLLSNRLAAAAHVDAWHHKGELAGQR